MSAVQQRQHSQGAVSDPAAPSTGAADAEWEARIEAIWQQMSSDPVVGRQQAQAALGELRGQQRLDLESRLTWLVGYGYLRLGLLVEAAIELHQAIGMAQMIRRTDLETHHLATLGLVHANMGAFSEAIECYERAVSLHRSLPPSPGNDLLLARVLGNFGITFRQMGLPDRGTPLTEQARELFMRLGLLRDGAGCLHNLANFKVDRAEQLHQQSSAAARTEAAVAARAGLALAVQVVADPALEPEHYSKLNARLTIVRARIVLGEFAAAREELDELAPYLTSQAHGYWSIADQKVLRPRLLRLTGRAAEAVAELQAVSLGDLAAPDRVRVLDELVLAKEAAGDLAGALTSFRRYHELTLQARDQSAEQRGQVLNARLELERAQHKAEIERLRAEQLTLRNEELARQAHMDALTGLPNRRGLDAALAHRIGEERAKFACVLADIDHFKRINDRYSHLVGDEVLRRVGALMREVVRDGDVAARYGGEEFALLLDRVDGRQAVEVCERLRTSIAAQPWGEIVGGLAVTISLGVAMRQAGDSGEALLGRADGCLYAAKAAGRDRVVAAAAESALDSALELAPKSAPPVAR
ncbi:MAG: diguanylate cyclase [Betaproteobacteria bacterium]